MRCNCWAAAAIRKSLTDPTSTDGSSDGSTTNTGTATCPSKVPTETAGPYPGDSSNGPNVLNLTGVVRNDIRSSFAGLSGTAAGVPLTVNLTLASASSCAPLANRAVYLWHCDRAGLYSLYSAGVTNQNYLRGVAQTDANGLVSFTSKFPCVLFGALAAHSLRSVSESGSGNERGQQGCDFTDCDAKGDMRPGVCNDGLQPKHHQSFADFARERYGVQRWAPRSNSRRALATSRRALLLH